MENLRADDTYFGWFIWGVRSTLTNLEGEQQWDAVQCENVLPSRCHGGIFYTHVFALDLKPMGDPIPNPTYHGYEKLCLTCCSFRYNILMTGYFLEMRSNPNPVSPCQDVRTCILQCLNLFTYVYQGEFAYATSFL